MKKVIRGARQFWLNLRLRKKGLIVTAIPVVSLIAFAGAFFIAQEQYKQAGRLIRHGLEVYVSLQQVRGAIVEEEKDLRGYAFASAAADLASYRAAEVRKDKSLKTLVTSTQGNAVQAGLLTKLSGLLIQRRQAATDLIQQVESGQLGTDRPAREAVLERTRGLESEINSALAAMEAEEKRSLRGQTAVLARALRAAIVTVIACIAVGLIGGILTMVLFTTGIARRIARLQEDAGRLAQGLEVESQSTATDEIGRLSEALQNASRLLRRREADLDAQTRELAAAQQVNQAQAKLLRCVLDSMGDGVVAANQDGAFLAFNPAAEKILGRGATETRPERWAAEYGLYLPDGQTPYPPADLPLARAIRGETLNDVRICVRSHAGHEERWIAVTARPLAGDARSPRGGVVVLHDVTEIKRAENGLQKARHDAEEANHAKSEFLSRMSHELRTPLNAILGFAQLLDIDRLTAPQRQSVDQILKGGRHLLTLINEVLDLSRIEAGKLALSTEPIRVSEAVEESVDLISQLAKQRDIQVEIEIPGGQKQFVLADRQRLQQVILNFVSNAIKYNRPAGRVTLTCREGDENRWRLEVRDTGMGLPPEKVAKLFTPFDRLGAEETGIEGTGIGLALSKRLMEAMGGRIGVRSEPGVGSTFWIELPKAECPLDAYERQLQDGGLGAVPPPQSHSHTTILYIEDNLSNNLLMERILENRPDVKLISAMQGRLGLELARQHQPHLIFLDLHLPDLPGKEVLELLREDPRTAHIPVAVISADATHGQIERLMAAGAQTYFTKPLEVKGLLHFIDQTLGAPV